MESIKGALEQLSAGKIKIQTFFNVVTETVTRKLGTHRVSIWAFNPSGTRITCLDLYDTKSKKHYVGVVLDQATFPEYFAAINSKSIVRAPVAATHPDTRCFQELYFKPNQIFSLLDIVISNKGSASGILCCEHCDEVKNWSDDDVNYMQQVSFSVGFALSILEKSSAA